MQKYRLYFPDEDWFRDEEGNTEFSAIRCRSIEARLADHVTLIRLPWPPGCPECPSTVEHLPEECPAAIWYDNGPTGGACEAAFLRTPEGRAIAAQLTWGTTGYYSAVIDGTDEMHAAGMCPL